MIMNHFFPIRSVFKKKRKNPERFFNTEMFMMMMMIRNKLFFFFGCGCFFFKMAKIYSTRESIFICPDHCCCYDDDAENLIIWAEE